MPVHGHANHGPVQTALACPRPAWPGRKPCAGLRCGPPSPGPRGWRRWRYWGPLPRLHHWPRRRCPALLRDLGWWQAAPARPGPALPWPWPFAGLGRMPAPRRLAGRACQPTAAAANARHPARAAGAGIHGRIPDQMGIHTRRHMHDSHDSAARACGQRPWPTAAWGGPAPACRRLCLPRRAGLGRPACRAWREGGALPAGLCAWPCGGAPRAGAGGLA